jgi:hypothetical protein
MATARRKRPWYLVLAVVGAMGMGTMGACVGQEGIEIYQVPNDPTALTQVFTDATDRAAVVAQFEVLLHAVDAAKSRGWPLSVLVMLLGIAVFIAAFRTLRGSRGARTALVQLIIAQAAANAAGYWLMRDAVSAYIQFRQTVGLAVLHMRPDRTREEDAAMRSDALVRGFPASIAFGTMASALIVVGLTRRRSLEYFEPAADRARGR